MILHLRAMIKSYHTIHWTNRVNELYSNIHRFKKKERKIYITNDKKFITMNITHQPKEDWRSK